MAPDSSRGPGLPPGPSFDAAPLEVSAYLDALRERVVIFDGAMGTNLQLHNLGPDDFGGAALEGCNELLVVTRPDVVAAVHRSFLDVGCDVVETDSFGSLPWVLAEYGIAERTRELARRSAELAREVAGAWDGRFVAGSLGPGTKISSLGQISFVEQRDGYQEAAAGLLEGGVDLLVIETIQDLLQAKAAIIGSRRAMAEVGRQVPVQVQVTIETTGRMLMGTEIGAALTTIDALRPDVIGLNCATGPVEMSEHLRYLSAHARLPISVQPNAGLPSVVDGKMHYDLTPDQLAAHHARFVTEYGVNVVGGCCGTEPRHLAAVVEACSALVPASRHPEWEPGVASIYTHVPYDQAPSFLVVGERTNANGSKKFREAMLSDDWDTSVAMAREAVKGGAHVLDVCVDYTGEDGVADMIEVAARFATQATLPIMLDSTEPPVIEAGLQRIAGKPILNSVNLEDGDAPGTRLDRFLTLAREYGAAVVCTCIDTTGQARTVEHKVAAARAIHDLAVNRYGLAPEDLIFDPLALHARHRHGGEPRRRHGHHRGDPPHQGRAARGPHHPRAVQCLVRPLSRRPPRPQLRLPPRVPAGRPRCRHRPCGPHHAAGQDRPPGRRAVPRPHLRPAGPDPRLRPARRAAPALRRGVVDRAGDRGPQRLDRRAPPRAAHHRRRPRRARPMTSTRALVAASALDIVNGPLLGGMKVVGELFGAGEMQLPFVLQSAETMKAAVAHLEPHMERTDSGGKGRIVLATVKGDVHDIGKNLVDIIFTNNGYEVHNLGHQGPPRPTSSTRPPRSAPTPSACPGCWSSRPSSCATTCSR